MMDYDIRHGRTYMYFKGAPLYPFGFGLSYTTFAYSALRPSATTLSGDGSIEVRVDVKNTGTRSGDEVVQLYASYPASKIPRPNRQLVGFARVTIAAGETREVTLPLPATRLAYWDVKQQRFVTEPGPIELAAGASSADLRVKTTIRVTGSK
jgi:beta-glucosidase